MIKTPVPPIVMGNIPQEEETFENIWEDVIKHANVLAPILLKNMQNVDGVMFNEKSEDQIRRSLVLLLILCFMNTSELDTQNLDEALKATKFVAKKMLEQAAGKIN
jgi:hypothetical protein